MIKSMTGFASLTRDDDRGTIGVTVRTVNHRFLDVQLRLPHALAELEPRIRALLQKRLARGRVELQVSLQLRQATAPAVELNQEFVDGLAAAVEQARERGVVVGALTPGDLLRFPQAITLSDRPREMASDEQAQFYAAVEAALDAALAELDAMRTREGSHLRADLDARCTLLAHLIERLGVAADQGRAALEERLRARIDEIRTEQFVDQTLVAQEIVRAAARSDISEEVTRFRAHLAHWAALADAAEPCGRKLDFLLQEMNREINTIGSKADGLHVSELVITSKAELEKLREQVQNVE